MVDKIKKYLPLSETTAYILLALVEPLHGYGVMQKVEAMSGATVKIGPGTLYGAFAMLESEGLIEKIDEIERRKTYRLDYLVAPRDKADYLQLFLDAGWAYLGEMNSWQYFHKPVAGWDS